MSKTARAYQSALIRQEYEHVLNKLASARKAMEHDSPQALKDYLADHPGADRSIHTVKKPSPATKPESKPSKEKPKAKSVAEKSGNPRGEARDALSHALGGGLGRIKSESQGANGRMHLKWDDGVHAEVHEEGGKTYYEVQDATYTDPKQAAAALKEWSESKSDND